MEGKVSFLLESQMVFGIWFKTLRKSLWRMWKKSWNSARKGSYSSQVETNMGASQT